VLMICRVTYFAYGANEAYFNWCKGYDATGTSPGIQGTSGEDCEPVDLTIAASQISAIA
jgi:hypothetical protein